LGDRAVANKGGNKGSQGKARSEDTEAQNTKDETVARDPDIRGVRQREAGDIHKRGRPL
jgi:hypothetical protein